MAKQCRIKRFFTDFRDFISRGNILDMAVGIIIGTAFGKIVASLVNDIIMPLISLAVGGKSVEDMKWVITEAAEATATTPEVAEAALRYGIFIQSIIDFLIIAFCIFVAMRVIMNLRKLRKADGALSKEEAKAVKAKCKAEGLTRAQTKAAVAEAEANAIAKAEAEKAAAEAAAAAEEAAKESSEDILKDIRELLRKN